VTAQPKVPPWPTPAPTPPIEEVPVVRLPEIGQKINEILSTLKAIYESSYGSTYWKWKPPTLPFTLKRASERELVSVERGGGLYTSIAKITMPDNTPPNVYFSAKLTDLSGNIKGTIVGESPSELYNLGLTSPNSFGFVTIYDTTAYVYAWVQVWHIHVKSGEAVTISIRNETVKDLQVNSMIIDGYLMPTGRYVAKMF